MTGNGDLDFDGILEIIEGVHLDEDRAPNEGLRERKKRRLRQKISDVATAMFLVHGFDKVTVAQIAAACEVSEQTAFNYSPTKESMFLDRSESMVSDVVDAVKEVGGASLVDAVVKVLTGGLQPGERETADEPRQLQLSRRFSDVAAGSQTLSAARFAEFERFTDELSLPLAQRVGADPIDPEVRLAALIIGGLVRVRLESTFHHVQVATSFAALTEVVHRDILKAAEIARPSLAAFDDMRGTSD